MPTTVVLLPVLSQTSSAVDTSTHALTGWDVSDAQAITFSMLTGTTTAPGPVLQVAYTSDSTATFFAMTYFSSGGSVVTGSSGTAITVPIAAKQARVITTAIHTGTQTFFAAKLIVV